MDYFKFDLQLFGGPVVVNLGTMSGDALAYCLSDGSWVTTLEGITEEIIVVAKKTVAEEKTTLEIVDANIIKDAAATKLPGLTVKVVTEISKTTGEVDTTGDPGSVSFRASDSDTDFGTISDVTKGDAIACAAEHKVTVTTGATVNGMTAAAESQFVLNATNSYLVTGKVTVAKGGTNQALIGGYEAANTYVNKSETNAATLTAAIVSTATVVTIDSGEVQVPGDGAFTVGTGAYQNATAESVVATVTVADGALSFGQNVAIAKMAGSPAAAAVTITNTSEAEGKAVTLDAATGAVTGVATGGKCSVKIAEEDTSATIMGKAYKAKTANTTITYDGTTTALTGGSVELAKGDAITANSTLLTNTGTAALTVTSAGVVSGLAAGASFKIGDTIYNVTSGGENKVNIVVTGDTIGSYTGIDVSSKTLTVALAEGKGTLKLGEDSVNAAPVSITYEEGKNFYALVAKADGTLETQGFAKASQAFVDGAIGYFQFASTGGAATVKFYDMDSTPLKVLGDVTIEATALTGVTSIDVTNLSAGKTILHNLDTAVATVTGDDSGSRTYVTTYALKASQNIAVAGEADTTYWKVDHDGEAAVRGVKKCTVTQITEAAQKTEEALSQVNYFKVVTGADGKTTVTYVQATKEGATKIPLFADTSAVLGVTASSAAAGAVITFTDGLKHAVTAGSVETPVANGVSVVDTTGNTTLTCTTKFAWAVGTYYLAGDATEIPATTDTKVTTNANDPFQKVVVTSTAENQFAVEITTVKGKTLAADTEVTQVIATITVPSALTKLDATKAGTAVTAIDGLTKDDEVVLAADDATTVLTGKGALKITKGTTTTSYAVTTDEGDISVRADGNIKAGIFALSTAAGGVTSLTGTATTFSAGEVASISIEKTGESAATATVTFADGKISSIVGLDAGETFTVTKYEGDPLTAAKYTYTYDGESATVLKETDTAGNVKYLAGNNETNLAAASFVAPVMVDAAFSWTAGTYYFSLGEGKGVKKIDSGKGTRAEANTNYAKVVISEAGVVTLTAVKGNATHGVADDGEFTGAIAVDATGFTNAEGYKFQYAKSGSFTVALTNVPKDSTISGLGASDTLATATLAKDEKVNVGGVDYVAATSGALTFKQHALASGEVTVGTTALSVADGSTVQITSAGENDSAVLKVGLNEAGTATEIKSITGLTAGETVKVMTDEHNYTTYQANPSDATIIWRTAVVSDTPTLTVTKLATAGDDAVAGNSAEAYKYKEPASKDTTFAWNATAGNFLVTGSETKSATIDTTAVTINHTNAGQTFIQATVVEGVLSLKQGVVAWDGSLPAAEAMTAVSGDYNIAITAPASAIKITERPGTTGAITVTGVVTGSNLNLTGAKDQITTASLGTDDSITVAGKVYESGAADNTLKFTGGKLTDGTIDLTATAEAATELTIANDVKIGIVKEGAAAAAVVAVQTTTVDDVTTTKVTSLSGLDDGETVTITAADGTVTTYTGTATANIVTRTIKKGDVTETSTLKLAVDNGDVLAESTKEVASAGFTWPTAATETPIKFYAKEVSSGAFTVAASAEDFDIALNAKVVEGTVALAKAGDPIALTLALKKYDGTTLVDLDDSTAATCTITVNGAAEGTKLSFTNTGKAKTNFTNVADGSTLADLVAGSTVTTKDALAADAAVTVNGETYKATAATQIVAVATEDSANIVSGAITVTGTVTSSKADGTLFQTLTYAKGTAEGSDDGVQVVYGTDEQVGKIQSIKDLDLGETVTIVKDGVTSEYKAVKDGESTVYKKIVTTPNAGTVQTYSITPSEGNVYLDGTLTELAVSSNLAWLTGKTGDTGAVCYVEIASDAATIEAKTGAAAVAVNGKSFVKATITKSSESAPATVALDKVTGTSATALGEAAALTGVTVTVDAAGEKISFDNATGKHSAAGVILNNVGAGSTVLDASNWTENDKVTTATLEAGDSVTIGGKAFTAGEATQLTIAGLTKDGEDNDVPALLSGTVKLAGTDGIANTVTTKGKEDTTDVKSVVTYTKNDVTSGDEGVAVTVTNGKVTGLTGLNWAEGGTGESVQIVETVGETSTTTTYTATKCTETGKEGWVVVTREVMGGNTSQAIVADGKVDILSDESVKWVTTNLVTKQDFDWKETETTGYFLASGTVSIEKQTSGTISKSDAGSVYLKVVASAKDGLATVSELSYVKVLTDGTFVDTVAPATLTGITIPSSTFTAGVTLPTHTEKIAITGAKAGGVFTGLNDADTITGVETGKFTLAKTVGKKTTKTEFTVAALVDSEFKITGAGTFTKGVFTITGKAVGSVVLEESGNTTAAKEIEYTVAKGKTGNGVKVSFGASTPGEIDTVTDLDDGATVKVKNYQYTAAGEKVYETTTITKSGTTVTKTINNSAWPADMVMTSTTADANTDVFAMKTYQMASPFDFGATKNGSIGIFAVDTTGHKAAVMQQTSAIDAFAAADKIVLMAGVKKSGANVTIGYLQVLKYSTTTNQLDLVDTMQLAGGLTITAPTGASLTLAEDAFQLNGTEIRPAVTVTGAEAGKSYIGFDSRDTISGTSLAAKATITVGETAKTATKFTTGASGDVKFTGDGKAINGTFTVGTGFETTNATGDPSFVKKISGTAKNAVIVISNGDFDTLTGIAAGQSITSTYTVTSGANAGRVCTLTYSADKKLDSEGKLVVTRTQVMDGNTTTATAHLAKDANFANDSLYGAPTNDGFTSNFDWTMSDGGVAYFATGVTTTTPKNVGAVEIKPTTTRITKDNEGDTYLKVAYTEAAGAVTVTGLTLQKVTYNEETGVVGMTPVAWDAAMTGTLQIAAPDGALIFDRTSAITPAVAGLALVINGAADDSTFTNLQNKDLVSTTALDTDENISVNGTSYVAGADGELLQVKIDGTAAKLFNGVVKYTADETVTTTKGSFAVDVVSSGETPIVKVLDGEVTAISGLTGGSVTVTNTGELPAQYALAAGKVGVNFTTLTGGQYATTIALEAGATIKVKGTLQGYTAGGGALKVYAQDDDNLRFVDGTLQLDTNAETFMLKNGTVVTLTNAGASTVNVTFANSKVTSITGMQQGDIISVGTTTYTAISDTVIHKTVGGGTPITGYLSKAGGDIIGAKYLEADAETDISKEENLLEGQFSWNSINGRSTGYFDVTVKKDRAGNVVSKTAKPIAEQTAKTVVTATAKNTNPIYVVANVADGVLSIGAIEAEYKTVDGKATTTIKSADKATLLDAKATLSVTAPTTSITYFKETDDKFQIALNNVASGSWIAGLDKGDTVKTAVLTAGIGSVTISDDTIPTPATTITYVAGAKGALQFQGEGTDTTTLLNGTIVLNASGNTTALLSGAAGNDLTNNITVVAGGTDEFDQPVNNDVTVAVSKGVVTSITGLDTDNATVTVTQGTTVVTYTVLSAEWVNATTTNIMVERSEVVDGGAAKKTYASFTNKKSVYGTSSTDKKGNYVVTNGYKVAATTVTEVNTDKLFTTNLGAKDLVYVKAGAWAYDPATKKLYNVNLQQTDKATADAAKIDPADTANRGDYYLAATTTTDANGLTTIKNLQVAQVNAQGVPTIVSGATVASVTIDGSLVAGGEAKISYAIPKTTTATINDVAVGSVFTGVKAADRIDSAATDGYDLTSKGVTVYNINGVEQEIRKVAYTPGTRTDKATIVTNDDGVVTAITGLDAAKETVTITETTAAGEITTVYSVAAVKGDATKLTVTKTVTAVDGEKTIKTATVAATGAGALVWHPDGSAGTGESALDEDKESRVTTFAFDWTMAQKDTGYFAVTTAKNGATSAAVKTTKSTTLTPTVKKGKATVPNETNYLEVKIDGDGVLDSIKQVRFDRSDPDDPNYNTLQAYSETKFSGTINVTAPTATVLTFDRSKVNVGTTIADTATVAITGAIADSQITNLVLGDKVATAKLTYNAKTGANQGVTVGLDGLGSWFSNGAAGALSFEVKKVDGANALALIGGTIALEVDDGATQGSDYAYVGTKLFTVTKGNVTVTASTNKQGVTSYTIGGMKEGETFTVQDFETGTTKTYERSATSLFCTTKTTVGEVTQTTTSVYAINAGVSLASSVLEGTKGWTTYTDANLTFNADNTLKSGKAVTVDLAKADTRVTADEKAAVAKNAWAAGTLANHNYKFVIDTYMANPTTFKGVASVIDNDNLIAAVERTIGTVTVGVGYNEKTRAYTYSTYNAATSGIAQTIKAANTWTVIGSGFADTINGAAKGEDTLRGGAGNDTLTGGGANDTFTFAAGDTGHDVVKSYVTGKDSVVFALGGSYAGFDIDDVALVKTAAGKSFTADVLLHDGTYDAETGAYTNGVLLSAMGNGKAVTINVGGENKTYYFGSAVAAKGMTFTYAEGAYYVGKEGTTTANTLTVTTDKNKAATKALGDTVEVDLSDETHYKNITAVNAAKSGNKLVLTASDAGSSLTGGTYLTTLKGGAGQDTLVGGSGADTFWFDTVEKNDTVTGYASGKDSVYVGAFDKNAATATEFNGLTIKADGTDVVISNGDVGSVKLQKAVNAAKAITVMADEEGTEKLSYYVGKTGTYDKKGNLKLGANTFTATIGKDAIIDDEKPKGDVSLTSYYVGNDTATDTLKIVGVDTKTGKVLNAVTAKISLDDLADNLSSIDILDASGLTKAAGSKITLEGKDAGDSTLKGSALAGVTETFLVQSAGKTTVQNLTAKTATTVGDVIELAAGLSIDGDGAQVGKNVVYTLSNGGTLQIDGVQLANLATGESAKGAVQIRRNK